jgi:hypothetical protein
MNGEQGASLHAAFQENNPSWEKLTQRRKKNRLVWGALYATNAFTYSQKTQKREKNEKSKSCLCSVDRGGSRAVTPPGCCYFPALSGGVARANTG